MSILLVLAIAVLLLNYWLCLPLSETQPRRPAAAIAFSIAALLLTAPFTWLVAKLLSEPRLVALRGIAAVLLLAVAIQLALRFMLTRVELSPEQAWTLRQRVLLNCTVFSLGLLHSSMLSDFATALWFGLAMGFGFELALYVFTEQQARIARSPVPAPFAGAPINLISAGLMALALMGLQGLF